jgi:hypothetical protein
MKQIRTLADLNKRKEEYLVKFQGREKEGVSSEKVRIRVHMGTSGIASGARDIHEFLSVELVMQL